MCNIATLKTMQENPLALTVGNSTAAFLKKEETLSQGAGLC